MSYGSGIYGSGDFGIDSIPVDTLTVTLTDSVTGVQVSQSASYVVDEVTVFDPGDQTDQVGVEI